MSQVLTVVQALVGGIPGGLSPHLEILSAARGVLTTSDEGSGLLDHRIVAHGSALAVILSHTIDVTPAAHEAAWGAIAAAADAARRLKLTEAGHGLGADAYLGSLAGTGLSVAELTYAERPSESLLVALGARTTVGVFNQPLARGFADPLAAGGASAAFNFEVHDLALGQKAMLATPVDLPDLVACLTRPARYVAKRVVTGDWEIVASASTERVADSTGTPGDDVPVLIARAGGQFPSLDRLLAPYADAPAVIAAPDGRVAPWLPALLPPEEGGTASLAAGDAPRVHALALHVAQGRFVAVRDVFAGPQFDAARARALDASAWLSRLGAFGPRVDGPGDLDGVEGATPPAAGRWSEI